jgi:crotonobetainyl-CoA:carnitine CoA-transferase CaiB-like acyl-CoA transferase
MRDQGLLAGTRILDFTIWRPGPYATQLLAELGADVCKIEPPGGDPMRAYPTLYETLNVNKKSVMFDLKSEPGRRRALELAADADVVIEGYRPGVAARLGIGYDDVVAVNSSVVYCSLSGLGQDGPLAHTVGHDLNFQAWGGALAPDGGTPVVAAIPVADLAGGMAAAYAICAARVHQQRTGDGEHIDVAMADILATWTGADRPAATGVDDDVRGVPGYGVFKTADGALTLGVLTEDHFWHALCVVLALDDCASLPFLTRMRQAETLQSRIAETIAPRARDELVAQLLAAGVPVAPVLDRAGMLQLPHFAARSVVRTRADGATATGHPVKFTAHPATWTSAARALDADHGRGFEPRV